MSSTRLFTYYAGRGIELRHATFAKNLGLLTKDGMYNLLAQLLSDNSRMPVRVSLFRGADKASPMYSVRKFGNTCLLLSLDKVLEYGEVLNVPQADERDRVVERKEIPLFDAEAYHEVVINAFVHNAWVSGNAPMISVFSDRIEILSRGTLAPGQSMEGFFLGESVPVNRALSDLFLQLHISERSGRGVPRIIKAYGRDCLLLECVMGSGELSIELLPRELDPRNETMLRVHSDGNCRVRCVVPLHIPHQGCSHLHRLSRPVEGGHMPLVTAPGRGVLSCRFLTGTCLGGMQALLS